ALLSAVATPATAAPAAPAAPATAGRAAAGSGALSPTVEEQRLDRAAPREILRRSGFDDVAPDFARALDRARSVPQARRAVLRQGGALWRRAVDRVQGRGPAGGGPAGGGLSRDDDRPLYWARLGMTRQLRTWEPRFALGEQERAGLIGELERSSRGQDAIRYPHGKGLKRVLVTGFDPFTLDRDVRISNPSGAAALALDGTVIDTAAGPARI